MEHQDTSGGRGDSLRGGAVDGGVLLLSPCGWGNLGDSAILDSAIRAIRKRHPDWPIVGLTLNPKDTAARHGIPSYTCAGFSRDQYGIAVWSPRSLPGEAAAPDSPAPNATRPPLRNRIGKMLGVSAAPVRVVRRGLEELRHRAWIRQELGRPRLLIVAGGGQLDDFWGGALGHPYVLWRWARFAKREGCAVAFLSVGTGSLATPGARWFVHQALSLASYRSFRDQGSRRLIGEDSVARDPIVPDLAFGLTVAAQRPEAGDRRRIAVSPICFCDPRAWPVPDRERYESYIHRLATVCATELQRGSALVLFTSNRSDEPPVDDLLAELGRLVDARTLERVERLRVTTHEELLDAVRQTHLVVASRLHSALLSHVAGVPVAAVSYERKVAALLADVGHQEYCFGIDDFVPSEVSKRLDEMLLARERLQAEISERVARCHAEVEAQYDAVLGPAAT